MAEVRLQFERTGDGQAAVAARSARVDELIRGLWQGEVAAEPKLANGVALAAIGGYGRGQLFPYSDIDVLFLADRKEAEAARTAIRRVSQALWDSGLKVSLMTRAAADCERFEATNPEFGLSLLDFRPLGGDARVLERMQTRCLPRLMKDARAIASELGGLTRERYAKYGYTLFHLEPNVKDCPGGLRDAHVAEWLRRLRVSRMLGSFAAQEPAGGAHGEEFAAALEFMAAARCFLHYRHERDDNTLDWLAQDAAAEQGIGLGRGPDRLSADAAYWMRAYFRHARVIERRLAREAELAGVVIEQPRASRGKPRNTGGEGFRVREGRVELNAAGGGGLDPAADPEVVLAAFAAVSTTGATLHPESEERIASALPQLSANLEEGPGLWRRLAAILSGRSAAAALRAMHALGVLELILPEFHGIDALVIRDAYHRYTVDEHTFVLIESLHELEQPAGPEAPDWRVKFGAMVRELQNPALLFLAALLHDTGKGRAGEDHAIESARMAEAVLERLEMDAYDANLVMRLIRAHLEMSAALRRDIFDAETVRTFAAKVQSQELLRMLTLFTYADIKAVHPDALTPWKAENLWRLSMAAANQLDRSVDEERVHAVEDAAGAWGRRERRGAIPVGQDERVARILALARGREKALEQFLEGFPERYLGTRAADTVLRHFELTTHFDEQPFPMELREAGSSSTPGAAVYEITLVTRDRPRLFANVAAALAAWGMNVVTADAFANAAGVVVDSFRFTDTFRTLELNASERERFVESLRALISGERSPEKMLSSRRRGRRRAPRVVVETRVEFDDEASTHSTLLQVVAQDVPGLLRAVSAVISGTGYNVEVALVDTEGETAIDVFYLTCQGERLNTEQKRALSDALRAAIEENARA